MLNPVTFNLIRFSLKTLPWLSALSIGSSITSAIQAGIDSMVQTQTAAASRSVTASIIGHVLRYPTNVVLAPVKAMLTPITSMLKRPESTTPVDFIFAVKKANDGVYQVITGPEFFNFVIALSIKLLT